MHEVAFRLKRAHLRAVEYGKVLAARFGLTPAWFDLLYVVRENVGAGRVLRQREIADALGVSPSTVSKMLNRLVARGLVQRSTAADARVKVVELTALGHDAIGAAKHAFLRLGIMRNVYRNAYGETRLQSDRFLHRAQRALRAIARTFADRSTLLYPTAVPSRRAAEDALDADVRAWRQRVRIETIRAEVRRQLDAFHAAADACVARRSELMTIVAGSRFMFADADKPAPDPPHVMRETLRKAYAYARRVVARRRRRGSSAPQSPASRDSAAFVATTAAALTAPPTAPLSARSFSLDPSAPAPTGVPCSAAPAAATPTGAPGSVPSAGAAASGERRERPHLATGRARNEL